MVLGSGFIAVVKQHDRSNLGKKGFFWLTYHSLLRETRQELNQGRILETGADTEAMQECSLLTCSLWLAQSALL